MSTDPADGRPALQVRVHRPLIWWRTAPVHLAGRLADPDHGRLPRWPSYNQDWRTIGLTVSDVADPETASKQTRGRQRR